MIFLNDKQATDVEFKSLLQSTVVNLAPRYSSVSPIPNGDIFETHVYEAMLVASMGSQFEGKIIQTSAHAFPDIVANNFYGIEVKMTKSNKWISTGNSVLESTRIDSVEKIYIFFGKFGGDVEFKYRLYQECLNEVGVTHSPRYKINMLLEDGLSIFDKMGVEYDVIRNNENPISFFKNYYRSKLKPDEELWWIDQNDEENTVSPVIRSFRNLSEDERNNYICDVFIFFPEVFGNNPTKFERPAALLITRYNAVSSSLRDIFTAGGRQDLTIDGVVYNLPKIAFEFFHKRNLIKSRFATHNVDILESYWRTKIYSDPLDTWCKLIDSIDIESNPKISLTKIFQS